MKAHILPAIIMIALLVPVSALSFDITFDQVQVDEGETIVATVNGATKVLVESELAGKSIDRDLIGTNQVSIGIASEGIYNVKFILDTRVILIQVFLLSNEAGTLDLLTYEYIPI